MNLINCIRPKSPEALMRAVRGTLASAVRVRYLTESSPKKKSYARVIFTGCL